MLRGVLSFVGNSTPNTSGSLVVADSTAGLILGKTNGAFFAEVICGAHRSSAAADTPTISGASLAHLRSSLLKALGR